MHATPDLTATSPEPGDHPLAARWDTAYEWRSILLLSLGFGLVGFDRFLILPMFPVIMADLHLGYPDLGKITGALAITWGLSAFVAGRLADRVGRKATMVSAMVVFSLLVGLSGLAAGALSLILIRGLMGAAEGAYAPPSLVATMEASKPSRQGLSLGLQQMAAPLLGLAVAPILVTQLMHLVDWRYIFLLAAPPGLLIAALLWRTVREPARRPSLQAEAVEAGRFRDLLAYRNVGLAALCMLAWLNALIVLTAFLPSYFVDRLKLPNATMGYVMSAVGVGAVFGSIGVPALSDRLGRRASALLAVVAAAAALVMLSRTGPNAPQLFGWLMATSFFLYGSDQPHRRSALHRVRPRPPARQRLGHGHRRGRAVRRRPGPGDRRRPRPPLRHRLDLPLGDRRVRHRPSRLPGLAGDGAIPIGRRRRARRKRSRRLLKRLAPADGSPPDLADRVRP